MESYSKSFFPIFIDIYNKPIKVFGGGKIAERRIKTLVQFCADLTVISPDITENIKLMSQKHNIKIKLKKYEKNDCNNAFIVIAATNNSDVNYQIFCECKKKNIIINIADCKEKCDFYFPAIIKNNNITIGISSDGSEHKLVKKTADNIRKLKNDIFDFN